MNKNYAALIFFLLLGGHCFSQTDQQKKAVPDQPENTPAATSTAVKNPTSDTPQVFERNPLPINQKGAPAIFYIANDQPIDRETYQRHLQPSVPKN
jgi:hypothetical protein